MPPLYVHTQGARLCYRNRLVVEKEDQALTAVTCAPSCGAMPAAPTTRSGKRPSPPPTA